MYMRGSGVERMNDAKPSHMGWGLSLAICVRCRAGAGLPPCGGGGGGGGCECPVSGLSIMGHAHRGECPKKLLPAPREALALAIHRAIAHGGAGAIRALSRGEAPTAAMPGGAGTELAGLLDELIGELGDDAQAKQIRESLTRQCRSCNSWARWMDSIGADECEKNIPAIVGRLGQAWEELKTEVVFEDAAGEAMVREAVARARAKAAAETAEKST